MGTYSKDKSYGHDLESNRYLSVLVPPNSVIALRTLLSLPENKDISERAQKCNTFEECLGSIAADIDIALDGMYDAADLCDLLASTLRQRHLYANQPHLRDQRLMNVELVERDETVTVEKVEGNVNMITSGSLAATNSLDIVKASGDHKCNWPGCQVVVRKNLWACTDHWWSLPAVMRVELWKAWKEGGTLKLREKTALVAIEKKAMEWILQSDRYHAEQKEQRGGE